jgi:DNA-binding NtrC family response regulator
MVFLVGDDREQTEKLKTTSQGMGCTVIAFTPGEWQRNLNDPSARTRLLGDVPALSSGLSPINEGAKILQFPQPSAGLDEGKVRTINELESIAIENAIHEFGGNLTEAAKALGIGRATLYRKVKQYNIDPSSARKKRAA